jgi:DNA-binding NtrC family response regulator
MTHPAKILVIDDDASVRKVLAMALEDEGYTVDTAENGGEAIRKSNANFYNLALIDIRLPDMEGTRLLADMKDTTPKMVKIIVTGYPGLQNAVESVNKGADAYIVKPFKMEDLLKAVREHLKRQEEAKRYGEEKVKEFIETRATELEKERLSPFRVRH